MNAHSHPNPAPGPPAASETTPVVDPTAFFSRDRFLLRQKLLALTETYRVFDEQGRPIMFVKREGHHLRQLVAAVAAVFVALAFIVGGIGVSSTVKQPLDFIFATGGIVLGVIAAVAVAVWLGPKRHIGIFADESMKSDLLKIYQDQKMAFVNATYTVADPEYNLIGWFRKNHFLSIFRKRWFGYNADGEQLCLVLEDSVFLSILRRVLGQYGAMIRTNFNIFLPDGQTKLGEFNRKHTILDKYVLDLTADRGRTIDRRLALALGVLLDTAEKR